MTRRRVLKLVAPSVLAVVVVVSLAGLAGGAQSSPAAFSPYKGSQIITMESPHPYTPVSVGGSTDDYHCTLVNPHVGTNSYIVGSHFYPNSPEVHHAIVFEVLPADVPQALALNHQGKGWGCFGESGVGQWLSVWAPGHGIEMTPKGTGLPFPKGSMIVVQVHYNLFAGHKPVRVGLKLLTVPAKRARLTPLYVTPYAAPPDIPCPTGVSGPLCSRAASLNLLGKQWGIAQEVFVEGLEQSCGRNPADPPSGNTTTCTTNVGFNGKILRIQPHMHLLGVGMTVTLNPGTPQQKVLLDDNNYNFHYQRSFDMPKPVAVKATDKLSVECRFNAQLAQELPQLRRLPPRCVTWGPGSANEMCLAVVSSVHSSDEGASLQQSRTRTDPSRTTVAALGAG